ncbi:COG1361 family protein [Methanohalobium evestigatum]|uniref:hypothetical protein n=1 Tax=Methanohalobium evestigatum TaxID=2322 RepID=UPI000AB98045|nr:hypothetical protein [Methanohalobium evestigatum]
MKKMLKIIGITALLLIMAISLTSAAAAQDVSRDLSSQTVSPGDTITVTLNVNNPDDRIIIDEMIPSGLTLTDSGTGNTAEAGHIKWVEFSGVSSTTYTYDVEVPMSATDGTTYNFDGTYILTSGASETSIMGEQQVTVTTNGNGAEEPMNVSRDLSSQTVSPGDTITVTLNVNNPDDRIIIDEMFPSGWSITNTDGNTSETGHVKWVEFSEVSSTTKTYDIEVPMSASGTYNFDGTYILTSGASETSIMGEQQVTVTTNGNGAEEPMNVSRDLSSQTVSPGDTITVTLNVNNPDDRIIIDEMIPSGLTLTDSGTGNTAEAGHIKWVEFSGVSSTTYTYDVEVPNSATDGTTYNFDGTYILTTGQSETMIKGDMSATVSETDVSATRDLPDKADIGSDFTVSIDVSEEAQNGTVTEMIPEGFECVSTSLPAEAVDMSGDCNVTFNLSETSSFEYTLMAPMDVRPCDGSQTYMFDGTVSNSDTATVGGDMKLDVMHPDGMVLYPGMQNMVSVPYALDNSSVDYVFSDVNYTAVSHWNASAGMWEKVSELEPLKAYRVLIPGDYEGTQIIEDKFEPSEELVSPASMSVEAGNWYAVGYTGTQDCRSIADTLNPSIEGKYGIIQGPYLNGTPVFSTTDYDMKMSQYYGYWVSVNEDGTLNGFGYSME